MTFIAQPTFDHVLLCTPGVQRIYVLNIQCVCWTFKLYTVNRQDGHDNLTQLVCMFVQSFNI